MVSKNVMNASLGILVIQQLSYVNGIHHEYIALLEENGYFLYQTAKNNRLYTSTKCWKTGHLNLYSVSQSQQTEV